MSAIFSKPKTPAPPPPVRMSDPFDPAILEARKKQMAGMQRRGGRESTILSDELSGSSGRLGG
jgi:hypothetical protein